MVLSTPNKSSTFAADNLKPRPSPYHRAQDKVTSLLYGPIKTACKYSHTGNLKSFQNPGITQNHTVRALPSRSWLNYLLVHLPLYPSYLRLKVEHSPLHN